MTTLFAGKQETVCKWFDLTVFLAASLLFLIFAFRFFSYAEDDAFIPMRYALNFWHGDGWVMNPGEHVEGCTSPLHLALVTALLGFLTPDQALWAEKLLGIMIGIAVLIQAKRLARLLIPSKAAAGLIMLVIASRPEFAISMINGLETGIATLLLTMGVAEFVTAARYASGDRRQDEQRKSAWIFLAAALARPELALTFPLLLAGSVFCGAHSRRAWSSLACYGFPLAGCLCLRWLYYGDLVPNTFWAKHVSVDIAFPNGLDYIETYALLGMLCLTLPLYAIGFFALIRRGGSGRLALATVLGLHLLFLLRAGGDWMMDGRFFVLTLPLCAIVWVAALELPRTHAMKLLHSSGSRRLRLASMAAAGILAFSLMIAFALASVRSAKRLAAAPGMKSLTAALRCRFPLEEWRPGNHDGRLAVGRWVAAHALPGQTVLWSEMGLTTIVNPSVRFLDIRGLTDRTIARITGSARGINGVQGERDWMVCSKPLGRYLYRRRPEWVALCWDANRHGDTGTEATNDLYVSAGLFKIQCDGRSLTVATWRRRDVPEERPTTRHN